MSQTSAKKKPTACILAEQYARLAAGADPVDILSSDKPDAHARCSRDGFDRAPAWAACARAGVSSLEQLEKLGCAFRPATRSSNGAAASAFCHIAAQGLPQALWAFEALDRGTLPAPSADEKKTALWEAFEDLALGAIAARADESYVHGFAMQSLAASIIAPRKATPAVSYSIFRRQLADLRLRFRALAEAEPTNATLSKLALDGRYALLDIHLAAMPSELVAKAAPTLAPRPRPRGFFDGQTPTEEQILAARNAGSHLAGLDLAFDFEALASTSDTEAMAFCLSAGARPADSTMATLMRAQLALSRSEHALLLSLLPMLSGHTQGSGPFEQPPALACVEMLAEAGCSALARDSHGHRALDYAQAILDSDVKLKGIRDKSSFSNRGGIFSMIAASLPGGPSDAERDPVAKVAAAVCRLAEREAIEAACADAPRPAKPRSL